MKKVLFSFLSASLAILGWYLLSEANIYPQFILPTPLSVLQRTQLAWKKQLLDHISITLFETLIGFSASALLATFLGYVTSKYVQIRALITPYLLALQSIPTLAMAPLLVIWFGSGIYPKLIIAGLIAFLPIFISALTAFASIDSIYKMDMQTLGAHAWQSFLKLELPAALPNLFGGYKTGMNLALMGAVVGEFMGAQQGLGYLINLGRGLLDTPLVFVALSILVLLGLGLYMIMNLLEKILLELR